MALKVDFTFDKNTYRHYMNGHMSVLHCHHYMSLTSKLAMDYNDLGGQRILMDATEDSMRPLFDDYIAKNAVTDAAARLNVGAEYYPVMGMGLMQVNGDANGGTVVLTRSHVDAGWIKKWGKQDKPVNYFTCGYIAAMFAAAFNKPARSYEVVETASIVKGDEQSRFTVVLK